MFKVFIVEDDTTIANIISDNLKKWGYETAVAKEFSDVFSEYVSFKPDLVLLDIVLPLYDGYYWCSKIRQESKVPIIFISSKDSNMDVLMAINMGADDYVTKPFSMEILLAKISALIRRTYSYTNKATNLIEHKGAILNIDDGTLVYNDEKIDLTKNEYRILYVLMSNKDSIVSRDKIMRNLWEHESFVDDNTLTVNINRLRKKLDNKGLDNFIATKKGQGYIIE
ncbi:MULTISPECIES: response regulator transcription factor [Vallitalea]|uniref:Stage 0 sporulation protein A homolog n=2 Tax=Vallitalea TaxID=1348611 RepID=A0A8J8SDR8_9FIRM|nr:response regulator transcription factor [Vallitalea guaymasensis]QUH30746.1 response regulator transcription factor [Vallitalea guaymasensis]GMQ62637.1 response regulator transcription factor [Vallitalea sp. AN17-2]